MTTPAVPYVIVGGLLFLGLAQKLRELRVRGDDPLRRASCACLASLALATTVQAFSGTIDAGSGVPHFAEVLSDAAAMTAACAGRVFLLHVNYPAPSAGVRARRRYAGLAAAVATVAVLFVAMPPETAPPSAGEDSVYFYVYIGYVAITLPAVCRLGLRYSRLTGRPALRLALRVIVAAGMCGMGFLAAQAAMLIGNDVGRPLRIDGWIALPLEMTTEVLLLAGVTIPALGARLGALVRWIGDCRSYRVLHPLWLALHETNPDLSLMPPPRTGRRAWRRDVGFLLYRQVIEIRDGQLALRPYVHPGAVEVARTLARRAGLPDEEVRAVAEAAAIAVGIAAKTRGRGPDGDPSPPPAPPHGPDLDAEISWLAEVSRAFTTSPVVPATVASLGADPRDDRAPVPHPPRTCPPGGPACPGHGPAGPGPDAGDPETSACRPR